MIQTTDGPLGSAQGRLCPTDSGQALTDADSRLRREWQVSEDAEGDREVAGRTRLPQGRRAGKGRARRAGLGISPVDGGPAAAWGEMATEGLRQQSYRSNRKR